MRITVLTYLEREGDKTHDVVVDQVAEALRQGGHTVSVLGAHGDLGRLSAGLARRRPDLVFNLMETFGDSQLGAVGVVGFLDLLALPYTGGGPGEYYIQEDKALTKKLLAFDGIRYPDFAVFSRDADLETGGRLHMPLFVKPLRMDASIGIDARSLVHTTGEMMERVLDMLGGGPARRCPRTSCRARSRRRRRSRPRRSSRGGPSARCSARAARCAGGRVRAPRCP